MKREFFMLAPLLLLSCESDGGVMEFLDVDGGTITIDVEQSTRGTLAEDEADMGSVGLYCAYLGEAEWSDETRFERVVNQKYKYSAAGWLADGGSKEWGGVSDYDRFCFNAYSPFAQSSNGIEPSIVDGELSIYYSVPTICKKQPDLMIARPRKSIYRPATGRVSLDFVHTLSSVGFKVVGTSEWRVSKIEIGGVCDRGRLGWSYKDDAPAWGDLEVSDPKLTYSAVVDGAAVYDDEKPVSVTASNGYLMMIPQDLPSEGVDVVVTLTKGENTKSEELKITSAKWLAGEKYSYIITLDDGGDVSLVTQSANCYILHPSDQIDNYFIPIDTRTNLFWGGNGYSDKPDNVVVVTNGQGRTADGLRLRTAVLAYDCESYDNFRAEVDIDGFTPKQIEMSKLDSYHGDFTDVGCTVALNVSLGTTTNGNVLVAVYKDGDRSRALEIDSDGNPQNGDEIIWSWHFWITDYDPDKIASGSQIVDWVVQSYTLSNVPGAVHRYVDGASCSPLWDSGGIYSDKFIMDRNLGATSSHFDGQGDGTSYSTGLVLYQYGRKDPFFSKKAYTMNCSSGYTQMSAPYNSGYYYTIEESINTPLTLFTTDDDWCYDQIDRASCLWNDTRTSSVATDENYGKKSFFDPSPLGWRLAVDGVWSDFEYDSDSPMAVWHDASCGEVGVYYPYDGRSFSHDTSFVYYPASGSLDFERGTFVNGGINGSVHSASAYSDELTLRMFFTRNNLYNSNDYDESFGLPVRCIQE